MYRQQYITVKSLSRLQYKIPPNIIVAIAYVIYVAAFVVYHDAAEIGISSLAVVPVIAGSWYFGIRGGILMAILSILANMFLLTILDQPQDVILLNLSNDLRIFTLILIAVFVGRLGTVTRERSDALARLEKYEKDRRSHTEFLELLNEITGLALEADSLDSTLKILVERVGKLFGANDAFFAFWDESNQIAVSATAYGSMTDIYPYIQFEPGERTPTVSAMEEEHPIAITDLENSPYISPKIAAIFPSHSMLALPLIVQHRKLAALLLGYNKRRSFDENEIIHAEIAAEQIALVLSKSQLLEEARKQVRQLTALHDIALISIEVDNEDQLIHRVTDIIGQTLFPDNFGILLLDERGERLHAHPSYRFFSSEELHIMDVPIGEGISGKVATTGKVQRIGNVGRVKEYLDVDNRTVSELCVPIKFKDQILGVINAESNKRDAFTEEDERLLTTLAGQIATAIEQIRKAQAERKWLDQLAHSNELIYTLAQITTRIERAFSIDEILQTLGAELNKIHLSCVMAIYDKDRRQFSFNYTSMQPEFLEQMENGIGFPLTKHTFSLEKLNSTLKIEDIFRPAVVSNPEDEIQILFTHRREKGISEILETIGVGPGTEPLRLPLVFEENLLGILWVWGVGITKADLPIMSIFAKQIGSSLEHARLFQEIQSLALTDALTGLHNRRNLFELGRIEFARADRMNRPFCCMMLDLDHFKQINDTHGHPTGDQILQEFAGRSKSSVREIDLVGRYGGEELVILLPETDLDTAVRVAGRLRASIAEHPMKVSDQEINVTVSIGVARKDENTLNLETLIARADQAMYIAKHKGRNQVAISK